VSAASELFLPAARSELREQLTGNEFRPQPRVVVARYGSAASTIGAALIAAERTAKD
jgi:predicted NBD/HSP70 family sugar kinase